MFLLLFWLIYVVGLSVKAAGKIGGSLATWKWLAPEIIDANSEDYDEKSDIFSIGVSVLFVFLLTFEGSILGNSDQAMAIRRYEVKFFCA